MSWSSLSVKKTGNSSAHGSVGFKTQRFFDDIGLCSFGGHAGGEEAGGAWGRTGVGVSHKVVSLSRGWCGLRGWSGWST